MKILLLQPKSHALGFTKMVVAEPLGLECIAGNLEEHEVKILDLRLGNNLDSFVSYFSPEVCGISLSYTVDHNSVIELANRIKKISPRTTIVVGGQHASFSPTSLSESACDVVVIGEGEKAFSEFVKKLSQGADPKEVMGLAIKENGRFFFTERRSVQDDMDSLPLPKRDLVERKNYHLGFKKPLALLETSRGCPYTCSFCCVWQFYGRKVKVKSPERVLEELDRLNEPYVLFVDDNFLLDPKRAERIALLIKESGIKKQYIFQARSDTIVRHLDLIRLWREIGLNAIFVGFEKITDEELDKIQKKTKLKYNDMALEILRDLKIEVWASFIIDPAYDKNDFKRISDYLLSRAIKTPTFSVLTPLPGTKLYEDLKGKITSFDFDLFDIAHSVLPTKLDLEDFYKEFCNLYRVSYSSFRLVWEGIQAYMSGEFKLSDLLGMLYSAKKLSDPKYYLKAHRLTQH